MTDTRIDELTNAVERVLLQRGFVHEDPTAYRAGVREAVGAVRQALVDAEHDVASAALDLDGQSPGRRATADRRVA